MRVKSKVSHKAGVNSIYNHLSARWDSKAMVLLKLWSSMCAPVHSALPPRVTFPGLDGSSTELTEGLVKAESRPSACGPSALYLSRCQKGWDRQGPHSGGHRHTPGHVATVACSHYALFLKLLVHPRQHCDVPREAEESRAKSQPQCLVPTLMTSLLAPPGPDWGKGQNNPICCKPISWTLIDLKEIETHDSW